MNAKQKPYLVVIFLLMSTLSGLLSSCQPGGDAQERPVPIDASTPTPTATPAPSPTALTAADPSLTPTLLPTFELGSVRDWGQEQLIFGLSERSFGEISSQGIFLADLESGSISQLAEPGYRLLDISPDKQQLLVSLDQSLYLLQLGDLSERIVSDQFFSASPVGAAWDKTANEIYFIASNDEGTSLQRFQLSSNTYSTISLESPISIFYAADRVIVWGQGNCNQFGDCTYQGLNWTENSGEPLAARQLGDAILLPCQSDHAYIYAERDENDSLSFHIQSLAESTETIFWALNTEYSDCAWSPDKKDIAVTLIDRGWYSGVIQQYHFQILKPAQSRILDVPFFRDAIDQLTWSPDGKYIAYTGTSQEDDSYTINLGIVDTESLSVSRLESLAEFRAMNYLAIDQVIWVPKIITEKSQ